MLRLPYKRYSHYLYKFSIYVVPAPLLAQEAAALVQALRKRADRHIPAILITADRSKRVQDEAQAAGLQYLRKPVKPASLRASLSQIAVSRTAAE